MSGQTARPDLYAVLGVPREAPQALIDRAYRTLVRRYHPDSRVDTDAGQASSDDMSLRHVMAAYRVIGHPDRRADYDQCKPTPPARSGTVPVRVQMPPAGGGTLITAGPTYWNPWPSTRPDAQQDVSRNAFSRVPRGSGRTPQAPSAAPPPSQWRAHGMTTETPTVVRDASELVDAMTAEVHKLRMARDSNRRIGMAIGIVMNQRHVDDQQAFDILRRTSQNTNRKLRNVAEDVIQGRQIVGLKP